MFTCPNCNSNKVEIQTTEIGIVRWLSPKVSSDGIIESLGKNFKYQGGETLKEEGYNSHSTLVG